MRNPLEIPFDPHLLLRKKRAIRRNLFEHGPFLEKRIAILGGSTTSEIRDMLELFLLGLGIKPTFFESGFNRYYEDIIFGNTDLESFKPELIYLHTSSVNISDYPQLDENEKSIEALLESVFTRFKEVWDKIEADYGCGIIQNNFELPEHRILGNLDAYDTHGKTHFIARLNLRFAHAANSQANLYLNDINYLSSWLGLKRWYDRKFWYSYKYAMSYEAIPYLAHNLAGIIAAIYGKSRKALVLDLDNTVWGGVIGEEGVKNIKIGNETAVAEAHTAFQKYIAEYKQRGILLGVCSKNEDDLARAGFKHPDSILREKDFSAFMADWNPKYENIEKIAKELKIDVRSFVFIDDDLVERDTVRTQLPQIAVPEVGSDISDYINLIDKSGYFETVSLSSDDLVRAQYYQDNKQRSKTESKYKNYGEYLQSLEMVAEIKPFSEIYLDRITQLVNKTNQFNLTCKRYSGQEIERMFREPEWIALYGRLKDKFGDNGLVAILAGKIQNQELHINLWLMSCRILKRDMEWAMFDVLVSAAIDNNIKKIIGYYSKTEKNNMVRNFYGELGFKQQEDDGQQKVWHLDVADSFKEKSKHIKITS